MIYLKKKTQKTPKTIKTKSDRRPGNYSFLRLINCNLHHTKHGTSLD